ncbi:MAG TPA: transglycosylase SLT domain-containing protein, partial [Actinophytocola sp.]|uniref:transglycosylase SLT domain-containing protein n=1 Tax=Actinophytocola sp. TaxID=1872138 RepID=UPI002F925419
NASGTVGQAPAREVAPGYQHQAVQTAGAHTGGVQQATTREVAPGYQHQTTPMASGDTSVQTTSPAAVATGPVTTPPVAAGAAAGGAPLASAQPVGGAVQPPPAAAGARNPADWPPPPRGVPSWGPSGPPPDEGRAADRAQLQAWVEQARQILIDQGVDPSLMNEDQMIALIQHESSGNPNAINLWDSNATAGHPSKGLMQTIDSTFTEHHLPGHDNIYAPVDNIIAGTRYAIDRYGSISDVPGVRNLEHGRGYVGY